MKDSHDFGLFMAGNSGGVLRSLPAGPALLAIFAGHIVSMYSGPVLFALLSAVLLAGCMIARRPIHRILLRAWPILMLAALAAWRQTDAFSWETFLVFARFCWMILAADLYVSSFGWQPMLARTATGYRMRAGGVLPPSFRRVLRITALTIWLTILQLPGIAQSLRIRRLAARARGLRRSRMLSAGSLSALLVTLIRDADVRAEALQARGIRGLDSSPSRKKQRKKRNRENSSSESLSRQIPQTSSRTRLDAMI